MEATQGLGIPSNLLRQKLECDEPVQPRVFGFVDNTHAPASHELANAESARQDLSLGNSWGWSFSFVRDAAKSWSGKKRCSLDVFRKEPLDLGTQNWVRAALL